MTRSGNSRLVTALGAVVLAAALAACDPTFGIGLPSTRALERGVQDALSSKNFEVGGTYRELGQQYQVDVQFERPGREHLRVRGANLDVEAIVIDTAAYFRGQAFLAQHMGGDALSQNIVKAAGNAWWKGSAALVPALPELTQADAFRRTFLGPAVTSRNDHVSIDGVDAAELSGPRAEVFISLAAPYRLLHIRFPGRVAVDGLESVDLKYGGFGDTFGIAAPPDVIDFSNLSTLPPIYSVISVDTSKCTSPCIVSALLKNLGGTRGARGPSTITFTVTATATSAVLGTCRMQVVPDVGYNATTTVSCTIANLDTQSENAAVVTASADNPGRG